MSEDGNREDMTPEAHLQAAIEHLRMYQQETRKAIRADDNAVRAVTEIGAAKAYTKAARQATEETDE